MGDPDDLMDEAREVEADLRSEREGERCHICGDIDLDYDCDSCGKPTCTEHTSETVAYGLDWIGCDKCRGIEQ